MFYSIVLLIMFSFSYSLTFLFVACMCSLLVSRLFTLSFLFKVALLIEYCENVVHSITLCVCLCVNFKGYPFDLNVLDNL